MLRKELDSTLDAVFNTIHAMRMELHDIDGNTTDDRELRRSMLEHLHKLELRIVSLSY